MAKQQTPSSIKSMNHSAFPVSKRFGLRVRTEGPGYGTTIRQPGLRFSIAPRKQAPSEPEKKSA